MTSLDPSTLSAERMAELRETLRRIKLAATCESLTETGYENVLEQIRLLASSPTLPDVAGAKEPQCQFGCEQAVGLYHLPRGCPCFDTKEQWLCEPHLVKLRNNGYEAIPIFERPRALPDVAGAGEHYDALHVAQKITKDAATKMRERNLQAPLYGGFHYDILHELIAQALTSAHLSGVREGREEAAALKEAIARTRTRLEHFCNEANAGRMPSDAREFMRRVQCGFDSLLTDADEILTHEIRALPDPPAGETT